MVKTTVKEYLPTSPMTLACPSCGAKPDHDCETPSKVRLYVVHLARVKPQQRWTRILGNSHDASPFSVD